MSITRSPSPVFPDPWRDFRLFGHHWSAPKAGKIVTVIDMAISETAERSPSPAPKLRGWFHLGATPAVFAASLVLFILSKESLKFSVALYSLTAITLFSVSAIYHRVPWSPAKKKFWRRWDHANIN
ncbi:MAG: hemolysin III family protein, partial [Candidatus Planktophila sp.]